MLYKILFKKVKSIKVLLHIWILTDTFEAFKALFKSDKNSINPLKLEKKSRKHLLPKIKEKNFFSTVEKFILKTAPQKAEKTHGSSCGKSTKP